MLRYSDIFVIITRTRGVIKKLVINKKLVIRLTYDKFKCQVPDATLASNLTVANRHKTTLKA